MGIWEKYKKIFIVIGFILIILILGYLLFALFFKPSQPVATGPAPTATSSQGGLPVAQTGTGQTAISGQLGGGLPAEQTGGALNQANLVASGGLTQTTELSQTPGLAATLSANGSDLLYYNKSDGKFYRLTKDGQASLLSDTIFHDVQKITWSPNKNKAILEYPDQAKIIYDFQNNKQVSLPSHWKDFNFSPDGSKIGRASCRERV
jgi:hypothetical protein